MAARTTFLEAAELLEELAGVQVGSETVRIHAERLGTEREGQQRRAMAHVQATHEPPSELPQTPAPGMLVVEAGGVMVRYHDQGPDENRVQGIVATVQQGVATQQRKRRQADRALRARMRSPGHPPVARREDRQHFWAAIAKGLTSEDAGVAAGISGVVATRWFRESGGTPTVSQAPLSGRDLFFVEREKIALLRARGCGVRAIARRSPSTISRELRRNAATRGGALDYRPSTAQWYADRRARRPKSAKLAVNDALRHYVQDRLAGAVTKVGGTRLARPDVQWIGRRHGRRQDRRWAASWSPEQIAHRVQLDFPDDPAMRISHEAIYQALFVQGRGALRRELTACLRTGRALRVPRARTRGRGKGFVTDEVLIRERPAEVDDRAVPGHWEGDLIVGVESSAVGTLVERTTRFTMLLHRHCQVERRG